MYLPTPCLKKDTSENHPDRKITLSLFKPIAKIRLLLDMQQITKLPTKFV